MEDMLKEETLQCCECGTVIKSGDKYRDTNYGYFCDDIDCYHAICDRVVGGFELEEYVPEVPTFLPIIIVRDKEVLDIHREVLSKRYPKYEAWTSEEFYDGNLFPLHVLHPDEVEVRTTTVTNLYKKLKTTPGKITNERTDNGLLVTEIGPATRFDGYVVEVMIIEPVKA